ncbi:MAG: DUF4399 domain-containing protein [Gammaproteobacteria bacterium]
MRTIILITGLVLSVLIPMADAQVTSLPRTPAPEGVVAYIQSPADGDEVSSPFTVRFGLRGLGVAPAGVQLPNTGHHHLLVNVGTLPPEDQPLPATDQILHYGLGQTETELELPPGVHTLQMVVGDYLHIPHLAPVISQRISITVTE